MISELTLIAPAAFFLGLASTGASTLGGTITRSQTMQYESNASSSERSCIESAIVSGGWMRVR